MLTPTELNALPEVIVELVSQAESDIIQDMARRISKMDYATDTAIWQMNKLREMGAEYEYIIGQLSTFTGQSQQALYDMFAEASALTLKTDDAIYKQAGLHVENWASNPKLTQIVSAGLNRTNGLFENLTRTTANTATRQFEKTLDLAHMQITSGAFSYQEAITRAIKNLSAEGIEAILYPSGHIDHLDVATRRATLTGVNQTAAQLQMARADQFGCDLVETTAHGGARPEHAEWQGKVFSRSGKSRKYPDFIKQTGYGTGPGLCGWNCRHSFYPFFEGLSEKNYSKKQLDELSAKTVNYNGEMMTVYDAQQIQRSIERNIRKYKREYLGLDAAGLDTASASVKLAKWRDAQVDFAKQTGLRVTNGRSRVGGFGRSQSTSAVWQNKKAAEKYALQSLSVSGDLPRTLKSNVDDALNLLPAKHRGLVEAHVSGIIESKYEFSYFNPKTKQVGLLPNASTDEIIHEYAHALEQSLRIKKDPVYIVVRNRGLLDFTKDDIIWDTTTFSEVVYRIESPKFVNIYQGRIYESLDGVYMRDGRVNLDNLFEYFSVGYQTYILNPELLRQLDPDLFFYIEGLL